MADENGWLMDFLTSADLRECHEVQIKLSLDVNDVELILLRRTVAARPAVSVLLSDRPTQVGRCSVKTSSRRLESCTHIR